MTDLEIQRIVVLSCLSWRLTIYHLIKKFLTPVQQVRSSPKAQSPSAVLHHEIHAISVVFILSAKNALSVQAVE
jgi:hypothetical protein